MSERSVGSWERAGAPTAKVPLLAAATAMPETFFLRAPAEPVAQEAIFFRARRRAGASLLGRSTAVAFLGADFYGELMQCLRLPAVDVPALDGASPEEAAAELRRTWRVGTDVLPNLTRLAEAHGVRVVGLPDPEEDVDAFSFWSEGQPFVVLARSKTAERARFDLAHELGHLVMHSDTLDERVTDRQLEHEANRFAAELLVPRQTLRASVTSSSVGLEALLDLKTRFGVSARAMAYSLKDAGRLSDWATRQVLVELERRGFRAGEPGSHLTWERSRVFDALPEMLRARGMSPGSWVRAIGQRRDDVHAFTLGQMMLAV
ncbi:MULTISPECIES: ImmA/IrrE family metallo-endopeptidase [Actinomyces]|uniref:ImmA/IrrE family metallo-endopeptidase n=1 Tax=Actinomyces respiraculi TaxID=2744574 RepID=A0A7T0PVR2_9ACTO|nr:MULTISPECIES: ImmA/IrrE family metallo-endopeptidase [Actinomyces]QPL05556.1 ImmA/IrrE family metallo-endopeptidase [Actinomyces respiraculi]